MTTRRRFVLRTIRGGSVVIDGVIYRPDERFMVYDGRLDGQRFAFARYFEGYYANTPPAPHIALWGTEEFYRDADAPWPGPECVDGRFVWEWWRSTATLGGEG